MPTPIFSYFNFSIFGLVVLLLFSNVIISWKLKEYKKNLFKIDVVFASLIAFGYLALAVCSPHYFIELPNDFSQNSSANVGNTLNGLMAPFVAVSAAVLTFIAFFVQYNANQEMLRNNAKQQEERQFYEMLKIHRDNVDKLEWKILKDETEYDVYGLNFFKRPINVYMKKPPFTVVKKLDHISTIGQGVLRLYLNELMLVYACYLEKGNKDFWNAYKIFFEGLENASVECKLNESVDLYSLLIETQKYVNRPDCGMSLSKKIKNISRGQGRCNVFIGHRDVLNSYYRHLYHTVAYVADSKIFGDKEKKKYLKILRSQMTSEEQALLFFNWYSGYGFEWECKSPKLENHFFTTYKMIHNIELKDIEMVVPESELKKLFVGKFIREEEWMDLFEFNQRKNKLG